MVYQHLPNQSGHTHDRRSAQPRPSRRDQEPPASGEKDARKPGAIALITGRLMRAFRTHS
jgi:hypothetical protein